MSVVIVLALIVLVLGAAGALFAAQRSRDTQRAVGHLARETRSRDTARRREAAAEEGADEGEQQHPDHRRDGGDRHGEPAGGAHQHLVERAGHQPGGQSIGGHPEKALSREAMLDSVSLYWFTASAASSARLYWHSFRSFVGGEIQVPTACSLFPNELMRLSRRWADQRYRNIVYWNEPERGGHFAAWEQPELFVAELRAGFASMTL